MKTIVTLTLLLLALALSLDLSAQAAPPDAPTPISENCVEVATVGIIKYHFCETDFGNFFTNSFGFMLAEY